MNPSVPSNWISPASIWAINSSKAPDSLTASIEPNAASFSAIAEASTICWSPCSKSIVITAFLSLFLSADKDSYTIFLTGTKTISALVIAVAQQLGIQVAYLPGLTMRRVADLHPGQAKTDARDAYIIAESARTMPHTLRGITIAEEQIAELSILCGFDDDLAAQLTQVRNRLRGLLTQIHPTLERVLGPRLAHPAVVDLLGRYPTPAALQRAGRGHVRTR